MKLKEIARQRQPQTVSCWPKQFLSKCPQSNLPVTPFSAKCKESNCKQFFLSLICERKKINILTVKKNSMPFYLFFKRARYFIWIASLGGTGWNSKYFIQEKKQLENSMNSISTGTAQKTYRKLWDIDSFLQEILLVKF